MDFHKVTPADGGWIRSALRGSGRFNCEESLVNLFTWGNLFGMEVAELGGCLICRFEGGYSLPIGQNREAVMDQALDLYGEGTFTLFGLEAQDFSFLERYCQHVRASYERQWSDYIYSSEKLRLLTGKKLAAKRNHINAFEREHPDWHTAVITKENMPAVYRFHDTWCAAREIDQNLEEELEAARLMLDNFFALGLEGLILYAGDDIVAYAMGEPITDETYCVHVEKALSEVRGAYPLINREFARTYCENYKYINREDDSGEMGLRKAKMSYEPIRIVHKYEAEMERK
ncbi:MAG: DUF2156 domain-containing protein [Clostridia bacterium]|nr:DUF2156 domain-containing protein [Clostridia bacterium]